MRALRSTKTSYRSPPKLNGASGRVRRVGVEIEFAGVDVAHASQLVKSLYGGEIRPINRWGVSVTGTKFGEFRVEVDSTLLNSDGYKNLFEKLGVGSEGRETVDNAVEAIVKTFVPNEIVCPPVDVTALPELEGLREALYVRGALGTRASLLYAFGFQLNPEVPARDPISLKEHIAAFLLLYDWIVEEAQIALTRKIAPFIDPFPEEYRQLVLAPNYQPTEDQLLDDYLEHNPTRNRPLDMLPMFACINETKVRAALPEKEKVNKRPTFHYRLPNCLIDDPEWSFATEWNRWVEVERLAADPARMRAMADAYFHLAQKPFRLHKRWAKEAAAFVDRDTAELLAG